MIKFIRTNNVIMLPEDNSLKIISEVEKHALDIDLKELLKKAFAKKEGEVPIPGQDKSALLDSYIKGLESMIDHYCSYNGIDFENSVAIIFTLDSKEVMGNYTYFLAQMLLLNPIYEAEEILNHHLVSNKINDKIYFIRSVRHSLKDHIKREKVFDNNNLLEVISKWANAEEKNLKDEQNPSIKTLDAFTVINLDGISSEGRGKTEDISRIGNSNLDSGKDLALPSLRLTEKPNASKFISRLDSQLKTKGHIKKDGEFLNVFVSRQKATWHGDIGPLAYLLNYLLEEGYILGSGKVGNEIWNAAELYFTICDINEKITEKPLFANALYRFKKSKKKYPAILAEMDSMLKSISENL